MGLSLATRGAEGAAGVKAEIFRCAACCEAAGISVVVRFDARMYILSHHSLHIANNILGFVDPA